MSPHLHALVICNGETPSPSLVRRHARGADLIVAADGGANAARKCGVTPDVIIGDLDSLAVATRRHFVGTTIIRVKRQDNTDLEKALDYLCSTPARSVTILGATGRRIDFTLGNLAVLWNYTTYLDVTVAGDGWQAMPVGREILLTIKKGTTVSLIPFGVCSGITLKGFRFPLHNHRMRVGEVGVSNVAVRSRCSVHVRRGKMLLIVFGAASLMKR